MFRRATTPFERVKLGEFNPTKKRSLITPQKPHTAPIRKGRTPENIEKEWGGSYGAVAKNSSIFDPKRLGPGGANPLEKKACLDAS